jgi:DNA-binding XRE family transcriptional regulator
MKMHRRRCALTQRELAYLLLGISKSAVARYETGACLPPFKIVIALEIVFGRTAKALYPEVYAEVEEDVLRQAASFSIEVQELAGPRGEVKRELLSGIAKRAMASPLI